MSEYLNFSLEGKVALVTGASYGIGYAIASAYAKSGAKIVFCDIKQESVNKNLSIQSIMLFRRDTKSLPQKKLRARKLTLQNLTERCIRLNLNMRAVRILKNFLHKTNSK